MLILKIYTSYIIINKIKLNLFIIYKALADMENSSSVVARSRQQRKKQIIKLKISKKKQN